MFIDIYTKHKRLILVSGVILITLLIGWVIYYNVFVFRVTSITPNPNGASYLSPKLVVDFNKELSKTNLEVSFDGAIVSSTVKDKELTIELPDMVGDKNYTITIESVQSTSGDIIAHHSITLNTANNTDSLTNEDIQENLAKQEANKSPVMSDPIFSYLPHSTLDYTVDAQVNNADTNLQSITITITVQLSAADVKIDRNAAIQQYQQEAMDYLKSLKDVDLTKYTIETSVTDPTS